MKISPVPGRTRLGLGFVAAATLFALTAGSAWAPTVPPTPARTYVTNGPVYAVVHSGGTAYIGGSFTKIGGQTRNRIAALDAGTGQATPWNPDADGTVRALGVSGQVVYAGGGFTRIGGQPRNRVAALDENGAATSWNPDANGP